MDITAKDMLGVVQDGPAVVGQNDFYLTAAALDEILVVSDIIHAGKEMLVVAEELPVLLLAENIPIGGYPLLIYQILIYQVIAHLVSGIAELKDNFLDPRGNTPETDGKTVPAENGEDHA